MPTHARVMSENLRESIAHFKSLLIDIGREMDGTKVPHGNSTRWQIASASLYLATQHAEAICMLIQRHDNEAAGLHLRALFEIYIRLMYMSSKDDDSRLLAVLYADIVSYERYSKDLKSVNQDAYNLATNELRNQLDHVNSRVETHIRDSRQQAGVYREQLKSINHMEFLNDKKQLKSGDSIRQQLTIKYMCRCLRDINGNNLLQEYASIYGNLSMYAHTSTVYLARMVHRESNGTIRVGTVSEKQHEEDSIRNLATAYHYIAELMLQCLREKGLSQIELDGRSKSLQASKSKYDQFLASY